MSPTYIQSNQHACQNRQRRSTQEWNMTGFICRFPLWAHVEQLIIFTKYWAYHHHWPGKGSIASWKLQGGFTIWCTLKSPASCEFAVVPSPASSSESATVAWQPSWPQPLMSEAPWVIYHVIHFLHYVPPHKIIWVPWTVGLHYSAVCLIRSRKISLYSLIWDFFGILRQLQI